MLIRNPRVVVHSIATCRPRNSSEFRGRVVCDARRSRGIALILVIFIVALATTLVVSLTYATHLSGRRSSILQRGVKAEYLLKSAVNFARVMLQEDKNDEDSPKDAWGRFAPGVEIPSDLLGINEPNIRVSLELRPEDSKLPLRQMLQGGAVKADWRDAVLRLCQKLGFDQHPEPDQTKLLGSNTTVDCTKMVAVFIDAFDPDKDPYHDGNFEGFEGDGKEEVFPNRNITRLTELELVPGFTPNRMRQLVPFVSAEPFSYVNINFAPREVLRALGSYMDDGVIDQIVGFRNGAEGPFTATNFSSQLRQIITSSTDADDLQSKVANSSKFFHVVAKVEFDSSTFYMRAMLRRDGRGQLPTILYQEVY